MLKITSNELRHHPARFLAPIVAIMISLGFVAGVSIFMQTATHALANMSAPEVTKANLLVSVTTAETDDLAQLEKTIAASPDVSAVSYHARAWDVIKNEVNGQFAQIHTVPIEALRWADLSAGRWPTERNEIAISAGMAEQMKASLGDVVRWHETPLTLVGITNDPAALQQQVAYVSRALADQQAWGHYGSFPVQTVAGADPIAVAAGIEQQVDAWLKTLPNADIERMVHVVTADEVRAEALKNTARSNEAMKVMLMGFAAVAVLVGIIIISNTFTILLAQRRRQIGLLRAIGATGAQVRRSFLAEAMIIGFIGALAGIGVGFGVAAAAANLMDLGRWGIAVPWLDLGLVLAGGMVITALAATVPSRSATKVAPLEALRPLPTVEEGRRIGLVRLALSSLLVLAGAGLAWYALTQTSGALMLAIGAGGLIAIGVLALAPLYVPALLSFTGLALRRSGATASVAVANSVRNPRRSAATATAVMLAVGLIVTLQVATASMSRTAAHKLAERYAIDVAIQANPGFKGMPGASFEPSPGLSEHSIQQALSMSNIESSARLRGEWGLLSSEQLAAKGIDSRLATILGWNADVPKVAAVAPPPPHDDELLVSKKSDMTEGEQVELTVGDKTQVFRVRLVDLISGSHQAMVSEAALARLAPQATTQALWINLSEDAPVAESYEDVTRISETLTDASLSGSFVESAQMTKVLDLMLKLMTALLAVAVLVALVGVSNNLSLSVLERTRESALLRALGMQRSSLRRMLLIESLLLGGVGVVVGVAAGVFFGWLGTAAAIREMNMTDTTVLLHINWVHALTLIGVVMGAAALASVWPGRRAALATPVEALGVE